MGRHLAIALLALLALDAPGAPDAQTRGRALAAEAEARDSGWGDQRATLEMTLRNRRGDESRRRLEVSTLEVSDDGDRSLTIFKSPRDIAGTAFLSYTHALKPDDQWLFLPALNRVKRIASANKSGPFVGSEFAYEDLSSSELQKYEYLWLRDEAVDGRPAFVIEERPQYPHSGYTRRVVWLDQQMFQPLKVEFYDRRNSLLKTLTASAYTLHLERYWRPSSMLMVNHQTGKSTTLNWLDYRFGNGLGARDFDQNTLKRSR